MPSPVQEAARGEALLQPWSPQGEESTELQYRDGLDHGLRRLSKSNTGAFNKFKSLEQKKFNTDNGFTGGRTAEKPGDGSRLGSRSAGRHCCPQGRGTKRERGAVSPAGYRPPSRCWVPGSMPSRGRSCGWRGWTSGGNRGTEETPLKGQEEEQRSSSRVLPLRPFGQCAGGCRAEHWPSPPRRPRASRPPPPSLRVLVCDTETRPVVARLTHMTAVMP